MLNLRNLSERKEDILDMLIMTDNIFGTPLASMQQKCEVRKRDDEAIPGKLSQQHLWPCDECSRDESGNPTSHSVQDPKTNEAPASPCISTQATDECGLSACQSPGQKKEVGGLTALPFPQVQKLNVPHSLAVFWSVLQGRSSTTRTHMVCLRGLSGSAIWTILLYPPDISHFLQSEGESSHPKFDCSALANSALADRASVQAAVETPAEQGHADAGRGENFPPTSRHFRLLIYKQVTLS